MSLSTPYNMPWHDGETKMQHLMKVPTRGNPSSPFLTHGASYMVQQAPLLALGTLDSQNRPRTTVLGRENGLAREIANSVISINSLVDRTHDPVVQALLQGDVDGNLVQAHADQIMGGLTIDLETRSRVKLHGRMLAGAVEGFGKGEKKKSKVGQMHLAMKIESSLGNCPKYLNKKHIVSATPNPELLSSSSQLPHEAVTLLKKADMFFISTSHERDDMDTNHRGGPPGFVRMISNDESGAVLAYPEYSGNRLYQSLGNLQTTPYAGVTIPDFDNGDVLYLTGQTGVLIGKDAAELLPRSNVVVKLTITDARFIQNGLAFRGLTGERSPYNPTVRYATTEKDKPQVSVGVDAAYITLIEKQDLTRDISRFRFQFKDPAKAKNWKPGQYATLAFEDYLDMGYSHMRDDDPKSLNDDYLRTFTISSPPSKESLETEKPDQEFELTIRNVGRATEFLFHQNEGFELPLRGFEGEFRFERKSPGGIVPCIAGGIGITPVLSQLSSIDICQLRLLWSVGLNDIGLVADTFEIYPQLAQSTTLFVTGNEAGASTQTLKLWERVKCTGVKYERKRIGKENIDRIDEKEGVQEWYMCVGPSLKKSVLAWLAGRRVVYEDFNY